MISPFTAGMLFSDFQAFEFPLPVEKEKGKRENPRENVQPQCEKLDLLNGVK